MLTPTEPLPSGLAVSSVIATCYELMDCAGQCGSLWGCVDQCRAKACKPAKIIFDKLVACTLGDCGFDCLIGYNAYCRSCLMSTCPADWKACEVDACQ